MLWKKFPLLLCALALAFCAMPAAPQSLTTGDVTGVVTDPTGAVLPSASVTLKDTANGSSQTRATNAQGVYRFSLLQPGPYTVLVSLQGFQSAQQKTSVIVGDTMTMNFHLEVSGASTTVEVSAQGGVVQAENGNVSTSFTPEQIANVPNPGNDLSYVIQTAPGAVMNTQNGYGNTSTFGISAASNLFTVNGMNENDPFLNLNNSGATNLLLGQNDVQEATVVNNGYSGQYGGLAGANVNYVTKAGTNHFHGNADYWWNGSTLNANNFFNNRNDAPRPFDNANQWAASFGGPIVKDKTFFFVNTEGLRLLIPTSTPVNIPSPQFQAATMANLAANPATAAEIPFYSQIFGLFNNAPGANRAQNILQPGATATGAATGNGCGTFALLTAGIPCALQFQSTAGNQTNEWLLTARVDQNLGANDRAFVHFRTDHGQQATYTDPLNPVLNAQSTQPQYEGQFQENHNFGTNAVNQFIAAGSWYSAIFGPPNISQAVATLPYQMNFSGLFYTMGGGPLQEYSTWPQGRNVTQYQLEDDYSWLKGKHSWKFGVNFRRNDVTDYTPGGFNATIPNATFASLASFYGGTVDAFTQAFATRATEPLALYSLGLYAQDEWSVTPKLKITLALRAEHNSDPVCQTNCFARLSDSFLNVSHDPTQPYNQAITTGLNQALPNYTSIAWEPRFGFAWQPYGNGETVIRGGVGIFADIFPATVATNFDTNSPLKNTFTTLPGALLAPGLAGSAQALATASNAAFVSGFNQGLDLGQILAGPGGALFTPPNFYSSANKVHYPQYQEWNLEFQQALGHQTSLSLNYVGNHGTYLTAQNAGLNAYCNAAPLPTAPTAMPCLAALGVASFAGLPTAPLDPRFGNITEVSNPGISNYNGLTVSVTRRFSQIQLQANYTWSHALDDISNGGFLQYNFKTNVSVLSPQDPFNLRSFNYGNSDYDNRHYFSLSYVWDTPWKHGLAGYLAGWTVSGTIFARTGLPFTVVDSADTGVLSAYNYGGNLTDIGASLFGNYAGGAPSSCSSSAVNTPCFAAGQFSPATTGFGSQRRNQFYGPDYFDTDLTLMKNFAVPHWEGAKFSLGAQFFNLFNHPNFDQPVGDVSNSQFGSIINTVNTPTSILGSFLGADASPRLIQLKAAFTF